MVAQTLAQHVPNGLRRLLAWTVTAFETKRQSAIL